MRPPPAARRPSRRRASRPENFLRESELRQKAAVYRQRAQASRARAQVAGTRVAQSSFLTAATTWDRLAEAREHDADAAGFEQRLRASLRGPSF